MLAANIAGGIEVRHAVIERHVADQMPFMATERWMMLGTSAGGDRQVLHEVIRRHSLVVAEQVSRGEPNDLLDRLAAAPEFGNVPVETLRAELAPSRYVGRAPEQVGEFLTEFLAPLLARARAEMRAVPAGELRV